VHLYIFCVQYKFLVRLKEHVSKKRELLLQTRLMVQNEMQCHAMWLPSSQ